MYYHQVHVRVEYNISFVIVWSMSYVRVKMGSVNWNVWKNSKIYFKELFRRKGCVCQMINNKFSVDSSHNILLVPLYLYYFQCHLSVLWIEEGRFAVHPGREGPRRPQCFLDQLDWFPRPRWLFFWSNCCSASNWWSSGRCWLRIW